MPNLVPPVTDASAAMAYRDRILAAARGTDFQPLMTLYLTESTTAETIREAKAAGVVAAKLYPAGATTNSASGVTDIRNIYPVLEAMADCGTMMMDQTEDTAYSSDTEPDCVSAPEMACPSATGPVKCGVNVSFALLPGHSIGFTDTGSQTVLIGRAALYQNPFLASITPPPEHHS